MTRLRNHSMDTPIWLLGTLLIAGCDERVVEVARESADRQAEQNRSMARLQQEVAEGTRQLVDADAQTRRDIMKVHEDLLGQQAQVADAHNAIDEERKSLAAERRRASAWEPAIRAASGVALAVTVIGFCWYVLVRLKSDPTCEAELTELLLHEAMGSDDMFLQTPSTENLTGCHDHAASRLTSPNPSLPNPLKDPLP